MINTHHIYASQIVQNGDMDLTVSSNAVVTPTLPPHVMPKPDNAHVKLDIVGRLVSALIHLLGVTPSFPIVSTKPAYVKKDCLITVSIAQVKLLEVY